MLNAILDFLFPRQSLTGGEGEYVTDEELSSLRSRPVIVGTAQLRSQGMLYLDRIVAAADYDDVPLLKKAVHAFKYKKVRGVGKVLGALLADVSLCTFPVKEPKEDKDDNDDEESSLSSLSSLPSLDSPILCPVPLHWIRRFSRGFNQSELLAREVSKKTGWPVRNLLRRKRWTGSQVGRKRVERLLGVSGAFELRVGLGLGLQPSLLWELRPAGRARVRVRNGKIPSKIILVDDLSTTGATLNMCAETLKKSGAQQVDGLVLALG